MANAFDQFDSPKDSGNPFDKFDKPESTGIKQDAGNALAGLVRGAGSIGATLLAPVDVIKDAVNGKGLSLASNRERRQSMDDALQTMGAQPDSWMYKGGKLGGEILGTAGAGGAVANGLGRIPGVAQAAPTLLNAIRTGGFATGAPSNMAVRTAGGAINGAVQSAMVDPENAGIGAVIGGALPGAAKVAGMAGNAVSKGLNSAAESLMQSAIKPTIKQLKDGSAQTAVETLLKYGINPNKSGVDKLKAMIGDMNDEIAGKIGNSTATVSKDKVLQALGDVRQKFGAQVSPTSDLNAIGGVADDFANHPNLLGDLIPVKAAQEMKQGTYKILSGKYGQVGSAETEAQKALARGLKNEISTAVPGVAELNAAESKLLSTLSVAERRAFMELNKNPIGLASLASNPAGMLAFMADKSALFKSLAARSINQLSGAAGAGGGLLGNAMSNPALRTGGLLAIENNP